VTLSVEGLSVHFGSTRALVGVDLTVGAGERLGLLGPNGAGKATLLNAIGGLVRPAAGAVRLDGRGLTRLAADRVARAGVGRTFQWPRLFARMTVAENVRAGRGVDAGRWLALVGLEGRRDEMAAALTPGEGRRLELARVLAGEPPLLLLDEPCGGLNVAETEAMVALLDRAMAGRITILIEHRLDVVDRLCRRAAVLHLGEKIFDGPVEAFRGDARVREAYLGRARAR